MKSKIKQIWLYWTNITKFINRLFVELLLVIVFILIIIPISIAFKRPTSNKSGFKVINKVFTFVDLKKLW